MHSPSVVLWMPLDFETFYTSALNEYILVWSLKSDWLNQDTVNRFSLKTHELTAGRAALMPTKHRKSFLNSFIVFLNEPCFVHIVDLVTVLIKPYFYSILTEIFLTVQYVRMESDFRNKSSLH